MIDRIRRRARTTSATALPMACLMLAALGAAACHRNAPDPLADGSSVSMDVEQLWKKEAVEDPVTAYKLRLASEPDNAGLHNNLGNAYVHRNQMKEAIREFRTAARLEPDSAVPWNNLGTAYLQMGREYSAQEAFEKAIRVDARYALAHYNLGTLYDRRGDYDMAIELYLKALALRPELAEVKFNPQIVNNKNLMVVRLRHFLEESGNIALPLDRLPE
ncbi:MAG TPA: tetratricopeptide repeat protein [Candidatus Polarisedimenticolia bacterium]|nr:tetratricopeptide repeat protein [Candidatus Polarisedimenticolia bacterium]